MKKQIICLLITSALAFSPVAIADINTSTDVKAPVWEEYVPEKYQNPRQFPSKGKNIAELSVGIVLTDLLITAPVGIPMICHSTTKMKNQSWHEKKLVFESGLKEAESITNPEEKQEYYDNLLKKCKMTEKRHQKQLKKIQKKQKKLSKKQK